MKSVRRAVDKLGYGIKIHEKINPIWLSVHLMLMNWQYTTLISSLSATSTKKSAICFKSCHKRLFPTVQQ